METDTLQPSAGLKDESQLVTFLLKDEEFGFDIMSVQEIIRLPKMAKVPRTPAYVDGIANLRGVVLPVIDMRTRFGMERAEETDRTRVLVVDIDGVKTGLRVDRVKQVTSVLRSEIEPPPAAIRGTSSDYLEGVVKLDKGQRIVMALNAAHVCEIGVTRKTASTNGAASSVGNSTRRVGGQIAERRRRSPKDGHLSHRERGIRLPHGARPGDSARADSQPGSRRSRLRAGSADRSRPDSAGHRPAAAAPAAVAGR